MSSGGAIAIVVILILLFLGIIGWVIWFKFFRKEANAKNEGYLDHKTFKQGTNLISLNKKYKANSGIVLESGKLTFFKKIKTLKKLNKNEWTARVSEQLSGIVIAAPGSGKTQSTVIPTIIFNAVAKDKPRMIITDPKGEIYLKTKNWLDANKIKSYCLNFNLNIADDCLKTDCFNPLIKLINSHKNYVESLKTNDEFRIEKNLNIFKSYLERIIDLLPKSEKREEDSFWDLLARKLIKSYLALMFFSLEESNFNFKNIRTYDQINLDNLLENLRKDDTVDLSNKLKSFLFSEKANDSKNWFLKYADWVSENDKNIGSFKATATNILEIFDKPEMQIMSTKSDFDFNEFIDKQSVLFLITSNDSTIKKIVNFYLEIINFELNDIISKKFNGKKLTNPFWFILEEAGTIQRISWLGDILNQGRGKNLHLLAVFQNTDQIDAKYKGQGLTKSAQYKILYSSQDLKCAEDISKAIGYKDEAKNQQDLIIKPNQILKIEQGKSLVISVKTNKPYFTNVMPFYKIYGFNELDHFLEKDFFKLGEKYIKKFNFKELFQTSSKALDEIKPKQKVDEEICENEAILKIKFTKKELKHEWDLFLENNNFNDEILNEINQIYERMINSVLEFYKSSTAETYEWNSRRIFEQIGLLFKKHHLNWEFLSYLRKTIEKQTKLKKEHFEKWKDKTKWDLSIINQNQPEVFDDNNSELDDDYEENHEKNNEEINEKNNNQIPGKQMNMSFYKQVILKKVFDEKLIDELNNKKQNYENKTKEKS